MMPSPAIFRQINGGVNTLQAGQTLLEHISAEHGHCSREGCLGVLKAPAVINHGQVIPYIRCSARVNSDKDAKSNSLLSSSQCAQGENSAASCAAACYALQIESPIPLHGGGGPALPPCSAGAADMTARTAAQTPHQVRSGFTQHANVWLISVSRH